ncbi:MAG: hypothetical protein WC451_05940, partial [Patescibacteria group bacterium]
RMVISFRSSFDRWLNLLFFHHFIFLKISTFYSKVFGFKCESRLAYTTNPQAQRGKEMSDKTAAPKVAPDPIMFVTEGDYDDLGTRMGTFNVPLENRGDAELFDEPLEGEFSLLAEAGLWLQWMERYMYKGPLGKKRLIWTLCIYKASVYGDKACLHRSGMLLIKPARSGNYWRVLGPDSYEWRQMGGSLLSVIRHAIEALEDK